MTTVRMSPIHSGMTIIHTITSTFATALSGTTFSNTLGLGAGASQ